MKKKNAPVFNGQRSFVSAYVRATVTAGFWKRFCLRLSVQQSLQMTRRSVLVAVAELLMQYLQTLRLQYVQISK